MPQNEFNQVEPNGYLAFLFASVLLKTEFALMPYRNKDMMLASRARLLGPGFIIHLSFGLRELWLTSSFRDRPLSRLRYMWARIKERIASLTSSC